jgi:hypothetical protein
MAWGIPDIEPFSVVPTADAGTGALRAWHTLPADDIDVGPVARVVDCLAPLQRRHTRTGHQMSGPREPAKARQMIKPRAEMAIVTVIAPPMRVAI